MGRKLAIIAICAALAACAGPVSVRASQHAADTRVAKFVFGAFEAGTPQRAQAIGSYAKGCQAGAVRLPETGPTWQAMRLSRNRNWAQPVAISFVQDLSRFAATLEGWNGIYVGDMSQPRGGPMLSGHASHQSGLDIDIWMRPATRLDLPVADREHVASSSMQRAGGAYTNADWTSQHEALVRHAASDPRVARIFVFPGAKVAMCKTAGEDRDWLRKIRPWWGHHAHFHVRLNCPAGSSDCVPQAPPPPGDGCAEAQGWVDRILNPPPPNPDAPAPSPRAELTVADLPLQCRQVIETK